MRAHPHALAALLAASVLVASCGGSSAAESSTPTVASDAIPRAQHASTAPTLLDWPEFGLDPQRSGVSEASSGIGSAQLRHLRRRSVSLPGTVDSSPIYLHGAQVAGRSRNVLVVTTTYGKTVALDADSGELLWTFTPGGYGRWAG